MQNEQLGVNTEWIIKAYVITAHHQGNQVLLWFDPSAIPKQQKHRALDLAEHERFQMAIIFLKMKEK